MGFDIISGLGAVLENQFQLGDNKLHSLDIVRDGRTIQAGKLGDFANKFDHTAERSYTEEGWFRNDLSNPHPKQLEILMQQPEVTVLIKKRALSSLVENYRPDLMNKEEQMFIRATKILFQNKCKQISAYEQLTKINNIAAAVGSVDQHLFPILFAATDALDGLGDLVGGTPNAAFGKFKKIINKIRTVINLSNEQFNTTWVTNVMNTFATSFAAGTGVMELTTFSSVNTTVSTNFGRGTFDISFIDPYGLMRITHNDIEQALADATNRALSSQTTQLGLQALNHTIQLNKESLNKTRIARGANPINFIVEANTFLSKRVRAIIDNSGVEIIFDGNMFNVSVDLGYLLDEEVNRNILGFGVSKEIADILPQEAVSRNVGISGLGFKSGKDGLKRNEVDRFKSIVKSLYNVLQINHNTRTIAAGQTASNNGLRKKLRLHYGGKLIIQPMDIAHIFVSSKTQLDTKILGGLQSSFSGLGFLQQASHLQDFFFAGQGNSIEKNIYAGKEFPNWLWIIMRNKFVNDKSGTQICAGIVDSSSSSYDSNGMFTVNVKGQDNAAYFKLGVVNFKPALDVWNGSLYDPLTPFNIKFDKATGVQINTQPEPLDENKKLFNSKFIKYKSGPYIGRKPNINNFMSDTDRTNNANIRRISYDPDGLIYKWKEGIGSLVMFGNNYKEDSDANISTPPLTKDPMAGQDVMNVLSLLITGEPYNFATFYKAAGEFDNFARDPHTNADPAVSYFRNLQTNIKKRNLLYGNFVPFKTFSMDQETYKQVLAGQIRANSFNSELNELLTKKTELNDRITFLGPGSQSNSIQHIVDELNKKIDNKLTSINNELNKIDKPISLIGNDISLDYNPFTDLNNKNRLSNSDKFNKDLRKRSHFLTRRSSWKVRANEDINLFIVDDTYDKDYDIQAFEKSFDNPSLFKSDYTNIADKIENIRQLLDLEVFANTQGHIEIRPPQYNRIPSSVFYRMLRLKQEFGIQLYPQFLEDLFINQLENMLTRIEIIEDEIRMYGLALGKNDDDELAEFLSTPGPIVRATPANASFAFLSDSDGHISRNLKFDDLTSDENLEKFSSSLSELKSVETQSTLNNILSTQAKIILLRTTKDDINKQGLTDILSKNATSQRNTDISIRLEQKTTNKFDIRQLYPNSDKLLGNKTISQQDLFKILNDISTLVTERQKLTKIAAGALKNVQESVGLMRNKNQSANKLLLPNLFDNKNLPSGIEALIEDESNDDYGPGSGQRYIIKNHHIKNMSISENTPKFTMVEVQGKYADNWAQDGDLSPDLNGFSGGGNALTTAAAVDYDLWRMYGLRIPQPVSAPHLTQPESQCAPFAVSLLNKARKEIFGGDITIVGNEFMQPGEVVYVEHQDMLYYVESISQRINYGKDFTTTLHVGYGHMPGEYIPTWLDTIGKILYKNKDITNYISVRTTENHYEQHIGVITGSSQLGISISDSVVKGTFAQENQQVLRSMLQAAETAFSTTTGNYQTKLELRIFSASKGGFGGGSGTATQIANTVRDFLVGAKDLFSDIKGDAPSQFLADNKPFIKVVVVDSDADGEIRTPSTTAYSMARMIKFNQTNPSGPTTVEIDDAIHKYIVDCWIVFEEKK